MQHRQASFDSPREDGPACPDELLQQTNKRMTLNLLSQGAAFHTSLTAHFLVNDELESIRRGLTRCYDKFSIGFSLNYFIGDIPVLYGIPSRFWNGTGCETHPFHRHRLLATHGRQLWIDSKRYFKRRGWKKWMICLPGIHYLQFVSLLARVTWAERKHKRQLVRLAKQASSEIWNIDVDRLDATLTTNVAFGNLHEPRTKVGRITRDAAVGYGGVRRRGGKFTVVAKAWNWPLLVHELTKGTVELIFLHGLNTLDGSTYRLVTAEADQLEYETWMLQAGSEMWRKLLAVVPSDRPLAEVLMHIARLDPEPLELLMMDVIEDPLHARQVLANLG